MSQAGLHGASAIKEDELPREGQYWFRGSQDDPPEETLCLFLSSVNLATIPGWSSLR